MKQPLWLQQEYAYAKCAVRVAWDHEPLDQRDDDARPLNRHCDDSCPDGVYVALCQGCVAVRPKDDRRSEHTVYDEAKMR